MATPSVQLAAQATPLGSSLTPLFLLQPSSKQSENPLALVLKICSDPTAFHPWPCPGLDYRTPLPAGLPASAQASCLCPGSPSFPYTHNMVITGKLKSDYPTALLTTLQQLPTSLALKSKPLQRSSRPDDMSLSVPVLPASSLFLEHTYLISLPGRLVPQMSAWPTPSPPPRLDTHLTFPCMP